MYRRICAAALSLAFVGLAIAVMKTPRSSPHSTRIDAKATVTALAASQNVNLHSGSMKVVVSHKTRMLQWIRDRLPF